MYSNYITPLSTNVLSNRVHSYFSEIQRQIYEINVMKKKEARKTFRFYKTFALDLICNFERKISKKIVFSLNKVICRKVYKDFRFYFVRAF